MNYDLRYSLIYGSITRLITLINQVVAVPLIIYIVGIDEFTNLNLLTAGVAWIFSLGGTLLPSLVGDITRAYHDAELGKIKKIIFNSICCLILFTLCATLIFLVLFNGGFSDGLVLVFIISICNLIFSISDNIRIGLHQNYISNIYNGLSNLMSFGLILLCYFLEIRIGLIEIVYITLGIPMLSKMLNFISLYRYISIDFKYLDLAYQLTLIKKASGFIFITASYFLNTSGLILIIEKYQKSILDEFIILQKFSLILMGIVVMVRNPLWSLISKEVHVGNKESVYSMFKKFLKGYVYISPIILMLSCLLISKIIYYWSSSEVYINSKTALIFSVYMFVQGFSFINSVMYYGMELFNKIATFLIFECMANILIIILLSPHFFGYGFILGIDGLFMIMIITSLFVNVMIFNIIKGSVFGVKKHIEYS